MSEIEAKIYDGTLTEQAQIPQEHTALQVKTQYHTAVSVIKPRQLPKVRLAVIAEAGLAGGAFYYQWRAGGANIEGPTIHLLDCIARYYGNLAVDVDERVEGNEWVFKVTVIDLETGYNSTRTYRARMPHSGAGKSKKGKGYDDERFYVMKYQAAQSKARRNAISGVVPRDIIDAAVEVAKKAVEDGIDKEGLPEARENVVKFFSGQNVTRARIEAVMGPVRGLGAVELAELRNYARQVTDGEVSADKIFPELEGEPATKPKAEQPKPAKKETKKAAKESAKPTGSLRDNLTARIKEVEAAPGGYAKVTKALEANGIDYKNLGEASDEQVAKALKALEGDK